MSKTYNIVEHCGADMQTRCYVNGKRESPYYVRAIKDNATRLDCFSTQGKQLSGSKIHYVNYCVATYEESES